MPSYEKYMFDEGIQTKLNSSTLTSSLKEDIERLENLFLPWQSSDNLIDDLIQISSAQIIDL